MTRAALALLARMPPAWRARLADVATAIAIGALLGCLIGAGA